MIIKIVKEKITTEELMNIVEENFDDMAKVNVNIKKGILSIGGEWHSEGEELLNKWQDRNFLYRLRDAVAALYAKSLDSAVTNFIFNELLKESELVSYK